MTQSTATKRMNGAGPMAPSQEVVRLERERAQLHVEFAQRVAGAQADLVNAVAQVEEQLERLREVDVELSVLVRRSVGIPRTRYHSADYPCKRVTGRGRERRNFEEMPESEAERIGLTRCTACGWTRAESDRHG